MGSKTTMNYDSMLYWQTKFHQNWPPINRRSRRTALKCVKVLKKYKQEQEKEKEVKTNEQEETTNNIS